VLPAAHTVPAVGFAVDAGTASVHAHWVFTGDTGPNPALWRRLADLRLSHLVIETAFSDDEAEVAHVSQHLHPAELGRELTHLGGSVDVRITHIKPGEVEAVMQGVQALHSPHRISALQAGQKMAL
jgi:ribonuclease BN (tRNA processing enzyme)